MKLHLTIIMAAALILCGCASQTSQPAANSSRPLPEGVIREGTLANQKLMLDASVGAATRLAAKGYKFDPRHLPFRPYVVTEPEGTPGSRRWTERWVFSIDGLTVPMTIDFQEGGPGAANYVVRD